MFEDFVGAQTCAGCHNKQYAMWRRSTHGNAGGNPASDNVISRFQGTVLRFSNATVTLEVDEARRYLYHVDQPGRDRQTFEVAGVVGGGHMMGGGTQTSFVRYSDGSWRLLPFDYSRHSDLWFCDGSAGRGWLPITVDLALEDCEFWPPINNFGPNCGNCHSSQMQSSFDADTQMEQVRFKSLAINCESCHGPGRRHVELMQRDRGGELTDIGMEALDLLDKQASVEVCFRCHALTQKLASGYLPGRPFVDYYSLSFYPQGRRYVDGRVKGFGYQEGHLYSDCFIGGSMTCVDCHDPHSQGYRDIDGYALPGKLDDGQCLDCHPAKAMDTESHTGHPPESEGSRCVACHMPFLQHAIVGDKVRFARSDHSIPVPRPSLDAELGLKTACAACHPDKPVSWQQNHVEKWHGETKPLKPIIQVLRELERRGDRNLVKWVLQRDFSPHPAAQLDILRRAGDILSPLGNGIDQSVLRRLAELARGDDLDVRALAIAYLETLNSTPLQVSQMNEVDLALRRRVGLWLTMQGDAAVRIGNMISGIRLLKRALEYDPARVRTYLSLAEAYRFSGRVWEALHSLRGASGATSTSRDEYLEVIDQVCSILDELSIEGMDRSASIDRLCAKDARKQASPIPISKVERP